DADRYARSAEEWTTKAKQLADEIARAELAAKAAESASEDARVGRPIDPAGAAGPPDQTQSIPGPPPDRGQYVRASGAEAQAARAFIADRQHQLDSARVRASDYRERAAAALHRAERPEAPANEKERAEALAQAKSDLAR